MSFWLAKLPFVLGQPRLNIISVILETLQSLNKTKWTVKRKKKRKTTFKCPNFCSSPLPPPSKYLHFLTVGWEFGWCCVDNISPCAIFGQLLLVLLPISLAFRFCGSAAKGRNLNPRSRQKGIICKPAKKLQILGHYCELNPAWKITEQTVKMTILSYLRQCVNLIRKG